MTPLPPLVPSWTHARRSSPIGLVIIVVATLLLGLYPILRYGGLWGEIDTNAATLAIRAINDTGSILPGGDRFVYPNGYTYQVLAVFLMNMSGISLPALHLYASSLLLFVIVVPAWLLFRELTASVRGATLATVLLITQPEFLFVVSRGTHEKFTRALMLFSLYLIAVSFRSRHRPARLISLTLAFYLAGYGIVSLNNLLSTSFIFGVLLSFIIIWFAGRYDAGVRSITGTVIHRLIYIVAIMLILAFIFTFYAYLPARHQFDILQTITERIGALFLNTQAGTVDAEAVNPYAKWVGGAWINTPTYFVVSLADWLLLGVSFSIWLWQSFLWLQRRWRPQGYNELLLWAFYGAFALQGAASVLVDVSGAIDGNLQHRIFPSFAMLAAPLVAWRFMRWHPHRPIVQRLSSIGLVAGIAVLALLSTLKATNEPLLSNKWQFYVPSEMYAVDWADITLPSRSLWTEYDERLVVADVIRQGGIPRTIALDRRVPDPQTRDLLVSDVTRARATRLLTQLPTSADDTVTYDNGQTQIYHLRPRTPYQR